MIFSRYLMFQRQRFVLCFYFMLVLILVGCESPYYSEISYQPPALPIKVVIDSQGDVHTEISKSLQTPLGTFEITAGQTLTNLMENETNPARRELIVQVDAEITVFDLTKGQSFEVNFHEDDLYRIKKLSNQGTEDIILILESVNNSRLTILATPWPTTPPSPTLMPTSTPSHTQLLEFDLGGKSLGQLGPWQEQWYSFTNVSDIIIFFMFDPNENYEREQVKFVVYDQHQIPHFLFDKNSPHTMLTKSII